MSPPTKGTVDDIMNFLHDPLGTQFLVPIQCDSRPAATCPTLAKTSFHPNKLYNDCSLFRNLNI